MVFFRPVNVWWFITVPVRKMHIPWHNFLLFFCVSIMPYYNCSCWLQWPQLFVGDCLSPWSSLSCWIVTSVLFKFLSLVVHSAFIWIQCPPACPQGAWERFIASSFVYAFARKSFCYKTLFNWFSTADSWLSIPVSLEVFAGTRRHKSLAFDSILFFLISPSIPFHVSRGRYPHFPSHSPISQFLEANQVLDTSKY